MTVCAEAANGAANAGKSASGYALTVTADELARFEAALGFPLPEAMVGLRAKRPHFETRLARLIDLNELVRIPGDPWVGETGDPWPTDHVVIGGDDCGNYYSVLRPDTRPNDPTVWFYDHDQAGFEAYQPDLSAFVKHLRVLYAPERFAVGDWTLRPHKSIGPIKFGMSRAKVRSILKSVPTEGLEPPPGETIDEFDSLRLHAHYRHDSCVAIEFFSVEGVQMGGYAIAGQSFADMCRTLWDPVRPEIVTPTSFRSTAYAVELRIEQESDAEVAGAFSSVVVADGNYFVAAPR